MDDQKNVTQFPPRRLSQPVKVVAVTGGKGGVGKSVVCANLALSLAQSGRRVMLLDGDLALANAHMLLGLRPRQTLRNVVRGECSLRDAVCDGPAGMQVLAGANGFLDMSQLSAREHAGLINCFSDYEEQLDVLMVDTAPGMSDSVLQFAGASSHPIVVLRDEPASIADAYAIMKLLSTEKGVSRFYVVTNMMSSEAGTRTFEHMRNIVERFLSASLVHAGNVPSDERLARSVRSQHPVVTSFPRSNATRALQRIAQRIDGWSLPQYASGRLEFFVDRLLSSSLSRSVHREAV